MKIIILGAGQVGASVAEILASEANDITIIDTDPDRLLELQDRYDLRTVCGHAAHPAVLEQAGAEDADMILAFTNSDETNMIACQVAWTLFQTPTKIARVRALEYLKHPEIFSDYENKSTPKEEAKTKAAKRALPIDVRISPEQLVAEYVQRLIKNPGALQVLDFAGGLVSMVGVKASTRGQLVGNQISTLRDHMPGIDTRVAAIFREVEDKDANGNKTSRSIEPKGDTVIRVDDEVFFIAATKHIRAVMGELGKHEPPVKSIIIAGGGNIGKRLAQALENDYRIKLIERDPRRATVLSEQLNRTTVLLGDASDSELLLDEDIEHTDVFCALTNEDEANILSSLLAKRLGARRVMSLINRPSYIDLVENSPIDIAISPQQATIGGLLKHVRRGEVILAYPLRRGVGEVIEQVVKGNRGKSKVIGRSVEEIQLPEGATIAAIVRGKQVIIAHHDTVIESEDHVILLLTEKKQLTKVERLFAPPPTFL